MNQQSLFAQSFADEDRVVARFVPSFQSWQARARQLLHKSIEPECVWWQPEHEHSSPPGASSSAAQRQNNAMDRGALRVPKRFIQQAWAASCHSNADRWALLYALLWRLTHGERHVLQLGGDAQVVKLSSYAKAVRRDGHKMHAFVRFRVVSESNAGEDESRYVAWFEPEHYIVEYTAGFFRRRFANMRWSILTPTRCAHWDGSGEVWFSEGLDKGAAPAGDALEDAWRTYYRSIFNPARLKIQAMRSEMPQKYWKNMPEAHLIPQLINSATQRTVEMEQRRKAVDEMQCGPRPAHPDAGYAEALANSAQGSTARLALQARTCRRCPLWEPATQTVFGEGPQHARLMIVGEQPGDQEDLVGRPLVGPAGKIFDRALHEVGLGRDKVYVTNAVKHFKFKPRGKRRLHAKPSLGEVDACLPWLDAEIDIVRPDLVLCMGATAGQALLGRQVRVTRERGSIIEIGGRRCLLTVHPSYLLRLPDKVAAEREYARFVQDLKQAAHWA